jgi:hypothetical protein
MRNHDVAEPEDEGLPEDTKQVSEQAADLSRKVTESSRRCTRWQRELRGIQCVWMQIFREVADRFSMPWRKSLGISTEVLTWCAGNLRAGHFNYVRQACVNAHIDEGKAYVRRHGKLRGHAAKGYRRDANGRLVPEEGKGDREAREDAVEAVQQALAALDSYDNTLAKVAHMGLGGATRKEIAAELGCSEGRARYLQKQAEDFLWNHLRELSSTS